MLERPGLHFSVRRDGKQITELVAGCCVDGKGVLGRSLHSTLSRPGRKNTETHQALPGLTSGQGDILLYRTKDEEIDLPLHANWHYLPGHGDESHRINDHFLMDGV